MDIKITLLEERREQDKINLRDYARLAAAATNGLLMSGSLSSETFDELQFLFREERLYADEALYDFLENIWTQPEAFSDLQVEKLIDTIVETPFDEISQNNVFVIADIIMKTSDADRIAKLIRKLKGKKNARPIVDFIVVSREMGMGG